MGIGNVIKLGAVWISIVMAIGCTNSNFRFVEGDDIESKNGTGNEEDCQGFDRPCQTANGLDHFSYETTLGSQNQVDILIVMDNSGSMREEQRNMADRFNNFIQSLGSKNWRLGITTTDISWSQNLPRAVNQNGALQDGNLVEFHDRNRGSGLYYLDRSTADKEALFYETIQFDEEGSGDERGICAANMTIDKDQSGFLRAESQLAIVVVSDENEGSDGLRVEDSQRDGIEGKPLDPNCDTADSIQRKVAEKWGSQKVMTFHSIITIPGDQQCINRNGDKEGTVYAEASNKTSGVIGDICADDYASQLTSIGDNILKQFKSVILACAPVEGSLIVNVTPDQGVGFKLEGDRIIFESDIPEEALIKLEYDCVAK
jgi:hypothetical protein